MFHVTHRCHDRSFLLKFARDRNVYRSLLREHLQQFDIALLDYCITSNHVHLLLDTPEREEISFMMREVAGEFARYYNRRKLRTNAFWGDNFHTTLVEGGDYLWRCLCYIELNMVRCGTVSHPQEWQWVGWHEITGRRSRYRLLDLDQLCWRLRIHTLGDLRKNLKFALEEAIARGDLKRERFWTESIAVGSAEFVKRVEPLIQSRQELQYDPMPGNAWALHDPKTPYGQKIDPKNAPKAHI